MTVPLPPLWVLDIECYINYLLVMVRNVLAPGSQPAVVREVFNDRVLVDYALPPGTLVTFNGRNYDMPVLAYSNTGADNKSLKQLSDDIILMNMKPWDAERDYGFAPLVVDHIDLIEVAPGLASLKSYGGRLHSQRLQDLPIEPSAVITDAQRLQLIAYCGNDLQTTIDLYHKLQPQLALREEMGREYDLDLRSKSDAQIAEAVIRKEVEKRLGTRVYRPELAWDYSFRYRVPRWVSFQAPGMRQVLDIIRGAEFTLEHDGSVALPSILESMHIRIGAGLYRMGIGGLHSSEEKVARIADDHTVIVDRDVRSYYPTIILNEGLYPAHMGPAFLEVYRTLVQRRLAAKEQGLKVMADALKITVNGSFGKLGSRWSVLYSPDLLIAVTLTGQLALLMLIESLEAAGFEVISANTDGVVIRTAWERQPQMQALIAAWEMQTGFETEEVEYRGLYAKDVNNYVAVKKDGSTKLKGLYAESGLQKNVTNPICVEAAISYITTGTAVEHTVRACADVRKFLTLRKVEGGAMYGDGYLGKTVRWYYARGETRCITYKSNGNKVARSDGARPLMELPDHIPSDVDRQWYVREAESILKDIGL
jgi:DNA polymerase elongation subunit (family B)